MTTPDFNDLTPPPELVDQCDELTRGNKFLAAYQAAYRAGAQHGWQQARQLWPEPIRDRPPTEADGDEEGLVQYLENDCWSYCTWQSAAADSDPWQHTSRWRPPAPKVPTLKEQALACLDELAKGEPGYWWGIDTIRRALEGGEGEG